MRPLACAREVEVFEAVACGRWPEACPAELRDHVHGCGLCTDVLEVARALHEDRDSLLSVPSLPPADFVWWRSQLRARQEAMRKASRPITLVETFGAAAAIGVVIAVLKTLWPWLAGFLTVPDLSMLSYTQLSFVIGFAVVILVITPLAMYVVLSDE